MVKRNPNMAKLQGGYLFPEINKRKKALLEKNPDAKIISLGIGNTTEPITPYITEALTKAASGMGNFKGYSGYGDEQGMSELRKKIADTLYKGKLSSEEIFISDGAKCDVGRLQTLFGPNATIAVQDPSYPVYVDGSVIQGSTKEYQKDKDQFEGIEYFECNPENNFFPDISNLPKTDLIYFCSPNNPTGAVATKEQLKQLVDFAKKNKSILIFDAAYSEYIQDNEFPKSILEIEGAKEVAIEINSFSKSAGFTGLRLGWSAVPKELKYDDGSSVRDDWNRLTATIFNGASNVIQLTGLAVLDKKGQEEIKSIVAYYMENAKIIKSSLESKGLEVYGGVNSPYIWARIPGKASWETFEDILEKCHVVTTPGAGFGPAGEGFIRFSAFGHRKDIEEAVKRLSKNL
ncbi:LL-diaminopimelate aminotransferase [Nanoarchaeota archaeon]